MVSAMVALSTADHLHPPTLMISLLQQVGRRRGATSGGPNGASLVRSSLSADHASIRLYALPGAPWDKRAQTEALTALEQRGRCRQGGSRRETLHERALGVNR